MKVRRFQSADQDAVTHLVLTIQQHEFGLSLTAENQPDLADIAAFFSAPGSAFWVAADDENAIVGCIGLEALDVDTAVMRKFMVAQSWRGAERGVSAALLAAFEADARSAGFAQIILSTVSATIAAQKFYERAGYCRVAKSELPDGYKPGVLDSEFFAKPVLSQASG